MTEQTLIAYIATTGDPDMSLAEAWRDFADAYGWDLEDNPYSQEN